MENNELRIYLIVNESLNMSPGKIAAQCGHAVQDLIYVALSNDFALGRMDNNFKFIDCSKIIAKIVLKATEKEWNNLQKELFLPKFDNITPQYTIITDEGRTEVPPNSQTVIGIGPITKENAKSIVGHLKLL